MIRRQIVAIASLALVLSCSAGCDKSASVGVENGDANDGTRASKVNPGPATVNDSVAERAERPPASEFTIATYNVNWGNRDAAATAQIIREARADLVCLQESRPELEQGLKRELGDEYPHVMFRGDNDRFPAERFGFLSKYRVRKETFLPARHGIFGAWIIEIEIGWDHRGSNAMARNNRSATQRSVIQVANVHLEPVRPPEKGELLTIFQVFADTDKVHGEEIARIHERLSSVLPTIVAGDFNSLSNGAAPGFLRKYSFVDSFAAVTENPDRQPTWRWPTRWIDLTGRIDYIFHSPHFSTVESRVADRTISDHSLVVSKLEWKRLQ